MHHKPNNLYDQNEPAVVMKIAIVWTSQMLAAVHHSNATKLTV